MDYKLESKEVVVEEIVSLLRLW